MANVGGKGLFEWNYESPGRFSSNLEDGSVKTHLHTSPIVVKICVSCLVLLVLCRTAFCRLSNDNYKKSDFSFDLYTIFTQFFLQIII